jgi:hypothetical protein
MKRDAAEQELLASHRDAVALARTLQADAERQLQETRERTSELRALNEELATGVREEVRLQTDRAAEDADRVLREAQTRARALVASAEEQTRALVADAEERLTQIRIERDAVAGYFESLRSMLHQADSVPGEDL